MHKSGERVLFRFNLSFMESGYRRYRIEKKFVQHIIFHPHPFRVKIRRWELLKLLLREWFQYRGKKRVITSSPCAYGVFSGPVGGFAARERLCVGCLRCTTEYPKIATILPNPARRGIGGLYMTPEQMDTLLYEAERGSMAVKGAGYRGKFGGDKWDSIWTDMSEIVRPTRDGIFGREYISTEVDLGKRPPFLTFSKSGEIVGKVPQTCSIPFPMLFQTLPHALHSHPRIFPILAEAASDLNTFFFIPFSLWKGMKKKEGLAPVVAPHEFQEFKYAHFAPQLMELSSWDAQIYSELAASFPTTLCFLRMRSSEDIIHYYDQGVRLFHLAADELGRGERGEFISEAIRGAHTKLVQIKKRDQVTLIGSGGMVAAEHVPKALLFGLDAVILDIPLLVALQGKLTGKNSFALPKETTLAWGVQRIKNLMGAWQDQLFEFAGAMGMREMRRMRGEMGRVLIQDDLEKEAFGGIEGYGN